MKQKFMKRLIVIVTSISLFLLSCERQAEWQYFLNNQSDYRVHLGIDVWGSDTTITIESHELKLFHHDSAWGNAVDFEELFLNDFDTIFVNIEEPMHVNKNIHLRENWEFEIIGGNKYADGGTAVYTFIIDNTHISQDTKK